jgi:hypothetical protein
MATQGAHQPQPEALQQEGEQDRGFHRGDHYTRDISSTTYQQNKKKKKKLPNGSDYTDESLIEETNNFQNSV